MENEAALFLLSLIVSGVGFVLFAYGRKMLRPPQLVAGLALMIYPYFTSTMPSLLLGGSLIAVGLYGALSLGW